MAVFSTARSSESHSFGDVLADTVNYKACKIRLIQLVNRNVPEIEICKVLNISLRELSQFMKWVRLDKEYRPEEEPKAVETCPDRKVKEIDKFLKLVRENFYIANWYSYYNFLKFAKLEFESTLHYEGELGIWIPISKVAGLARAAFFRRYPKEVTKYCIAKKILPIKVKRLGPILTYPSEVLDKTTGLPRFVPVRIKEYEAWIVSVEVIEPLFEKVMLEQRRSLNQIVQECIQKNGV